MPQEDWEGRYLRLFETICKLRKQNLEYSVGEAPPRTIPPELVQEFTMNGRASLLDWYIDSRSDSTLLSCLIPYYKKSVDTIKNEVTIGKYKSYGKTNDWLKSALQKYPIKDQNVLVFGSTSPHYECFVLVYGGKPITIEYNPRLSDHPDIAFYTPDQWKKYGYEVDSALSISSFEHDGLGRYGDPINPNGDLIAMRELLKRSLKPGGILYLSVPIGIDSVVFNAHRIYGYHRLPLLLSGWKVVDVFNDLDNHLYDINEKGELIINRTEWDRVFKLSKSAEEWVFVLQK